MPTFVIHALDRMPQQLSVDKPEIHVGRNSSNDIVLPHETVSREHCVFEQKDGVWQVRCVSKTNPIVVNGVLRTGHTALAEGSEILVGGRNLLLFSVDGSSVDTSMKARTTVRTYACHGCKWQGVISRHKEVPVCLRCGKTDLRALDDYRTGRPSERPRDPTERLDNAAVKELFDKIKVAKRSRLERIDGRTAASVHLAEDRWITLARDADERLQLVGFVFGSIRVAWDGNSYVARSELWFPSMKVNSARARQATLQHGDVIQVGPNRFRFVTE